MSQMVQRRFDRGHPTLRPTRPFNLSMKRVRGILTRNVPRQQLTLFVTMAGSFNGRYFKGAYHIHHSGRRSHTQGRFKGQHTRRHHIGIGATRRNITTRIITRQRHQRTIFSIRFTQNTNRITITRTMRQFNRPNDNRSFQTANRTLNNRIFRSRRMVFQTVTFGMPIGQVIKVRSLFPRTFTIIQRQNRTRRTITNRLLRLKRINRFS